jgi:uncharacterized protein (TIGR02145 family)
LVEELLAAIANGDYCGEGTIWVPEWEECIAVPSCFADLDGNGNRGTEDLLLMLSVYGLQCPQTFGCTDPVAENYDPVAEFDDGSCIIIIDPCNNLTSITFQDVEYSLVVIGEQCWFRDNLRSGAFTNGDALEAIEVGFDWYTAGADDLPARAVQANDESNAEDFGYLYNGYAVQDERGLCPTDWHIASDTEWMVLESELGMDASELETTGDRGTDQGGQLKSSVADSPSWNGTNAVGFDGVAAGQRFSFGSFGSFNTAALMWTSTVQGSSKWGRELATSHDQIDRKLIGNGFGASVRCLKDSE